MSLDFLPRTTDVLAGARRLEGKQEFFDAFGPAWTAVRCQVLKLETRQSYNESDNASYTAMAAGNFDEAMRLLDASKSGDRSTYTSLSAAGVEITRCRPISAPPNAYIKWELENYRKNIQLGERIYVCNTLSMGDVFINYAAHDFMVFDSRFAFIHDYDPEGNLAGGWVTDDARDVFRLISLFAFVRANCVGFESVYGK